MNYWINQDDPWVICFRGVEISIMAKAPSTITIPNGSFVFTIWEPIKATTLRDNMSKEDRSVLFDWVAECLTESGGRPVVMCHIDPDTNEELEIWCLTDARIENFECSDNITMTFSINFEDANQFKGA